MDKQILGVIILVLMSCSGLYARGDYEMAVCRYTEEGRLDESFGKGGVVVYDGKARGFDFGGSIALDSEGRILVAGSTDMPEE